MPLIAEALQGLRSQQLDTARSLHQDIHGMRAEGEETRDQLQHLIVNQIYNLRSDMSRGHSLTAAMLLPGDHTEPTQPITHTIGSTEPITHIEPTTIHPTAVCPSQTLLSTPPAIKMNRNISTVADAWNEYNIGLGSNPALRVLEETYQAAWRSSSAESKFFRRRLPLYRAITLLQAHNSITLPDILSRFQTVLGRGTSLRQFCDQLKKILEVEGVDGDGALLLGLVEQLFQ
jgi:hypothetical protein